MVKNKEVRTYTYYGSFDENAKAPAYGVHLFMVNEFITRHLEKEKEKFTDDLRKLITNFSKSQSEIINKLKDEYKEVRQLINEIIKVNELKRPIEKSKLQKITKKKSED